MSTLKDIAKILVQKHELKQRDADLFVSAFVETILEGLRNDRQVKIKGFGTFKVTAVRDRESVNVNTGERVVISGHDKISFTPDAVMRDIVNKPFAQFETVVLADDVNFDDMPSADESNSDDVEMDKTIDNNNSPATESLAQKPLEAKVIALNVPDGARSVADNQKDEAAVQTATEPDSISGQVSPDEHKEVRGNHETVSKISDNRDGVVTADDVSVHHEDKTMASEPVSQRQQEVEECAEDNGNVTPSHKVESVEAKVLTGEPLVKPTEISRTDHEEPHHEEGNDSYVDDGNFDNDNSCRKVFLLYAIVINILIAGIAFVIGYLCATNNWLGLDKTKTNDIVQPAEYVDSDALNSQNDTANSPDSAVKKLDGQKMNVKGKEDVSAPSSVASPAETTKDEAKETPVTSDHSAINGKYDSDPRVKTGAYTIVGTAKTVKVRAGQTIKSISKTYLGEGMECYVEAYNGGITQISEGQTIKIPELKLKKRKK